MKLNYSLIEIKSLSVDQNGLHHTQLNIYGTVSYVFHFRKMAIKNRVADIKENIKSQKISLG